LIGVEKIGKFTFMSRSCRVHVALAKRSRSRLYRAASRVALGDIDRARRIIAEAVASAPDLTMEYASQQEFYRDPEVTRTLIERLSTAGLPQGASVVAA
jgi:adenylate cyclase